MSTITRKEFNVEMTARVMRATLLDRDEHTSLLVALQVVNDDDQPTGTETFSVLLTNDQSRRIGLGELKNAFPDVLDASLDDLGVVTEVLAGTLDGKRARIRLEPQSDGSVNPQTGQPYYNVRLGQGFKLVPKEDLRNILAKRLSLGGAGAAIRKIEV